MNIVIKDRAITNLAIKNIVPKFFITLFLLICVVGCSSPEERAEKYYEKGMALLDKEPDKAKLEFQNALQIKKNMTKAMYGVALVAERKGDWKATFSSMNKVLQYDPKHVEALVKTGQILLAGGKLDLALERSNKALEIDKNNVSALNLRAAIQLKLNDPAGAVEYANLALEKDPGNQDAYVVLATERLSAKDDAKAIEYLDKALAKDEKNLAIQFTRIRALESLSKANEVEQSFQKVVKLFPDSVYAKKSYAQFLLKYERKAEAEQQLRAIAKSAPKDIQAKLDVVRFLIATKDAEAGRVELESFVKQEPENYELAFALVNLYQAQKKSAEEDELLDHISQKAGDTASGFKARGLIAYKLIQAGKKAEASKLLDAIIEADKSNELALTLRADLALEAKNYDAAIMDLRAVIKDSPDSSKASLMLATAHESAGSPELAEEYYSKAFASSKLSPTYGMPYVDFLTRRKQPERAEKALQDMLDAHPNDALLMRALAQSKISRGDLVGAQELADKAKKIGVKSAVTDQILGAISLSKNDVEGTVSAFKRAYETNPNDPEAIVVIARTYVQNGKPKEALAFIDSVLKANPNNIEAKVIQGQLYDLMGNSQQASQKFAEIIQAQPNNPVGYQQLAILQQRQNQNLEAESTVNKGLAATPKDFGLKLTQALIFETTKRYDEAIKVYENMIKDWPDSDIIANNLASLLTDHRTDKASINRAYELAKISKDSQIPQFLDTFGWASYKAGNYDEAEGALKTAITKSPEIAIFHYHLAKVYLAKNDKLQAKQALQSTIKYSKNQQFDQKDEVNELLKTL
jgi:cellulose synthase operon protein C